MSNPKERSGLLHMLILVFVAGFFTNLLIVSPIKISRWKKVDKNIRGPLMKSLSPGGNGFISMYGFCNYFVYGMFWLFILIIATNIAQPNFHFHNFYSEAATNILTGEKIRNFDGDKLFVWIMIFAGMLAFGAWSVHVAYRDINDTDYEKEYDGTLSEAEKAEIEAARIEAARIMKIKVDEQLVVNDKELNEIKIEKLPF